MKVTRLTKEHKAKLANIIKDCGSLKGYEGYDHIYDVFKAEKDYEINRVGELNACQDWLRGLPTCLTVPFTNWEIDQIWENIGVVGQSHDAYWYNMAAIALKLMQSYEV